MPAPRTALEHAVVGKQKTFTVRIRHRGRYLPLTGKTVTAFAAKPSGASVALTVSVPTPQTGDDEGLLRAVLSSIDNNETGIWLLDVYIGDTPTTPEPINRRYQFECQAKETES